MQAFSFLLSLSLFCLFQSNGWPSSPPHPRAAFLRPAPAALATASLEEQGRAAVIAGLGHRDPPCAKFPIIAPCCVTTGEIRRKTNSLVTVLSGRWRCQLGESVSSVGSVFERVDSVADGSRIQDSEFAVQRTTNKFTCRSP